mgnify:CR=1 FL=1
MNDQQNIDDKELLAMDAIMRALSGLETQAALSVISYVKERLRRFEAQRDFQAQQELALALQGDAKMFVGGLRNVDE